MRLTLRTLLAYLDDVLPPADTKLMGQKIQESPMAQLLVSRIREVMRRRRLKAPEVFGAEIGIDPNIVAQYLDNTLPPEQYADIERVLLASDELLAETAASHQILTLVGETTEVPVEKRERLYALGPVDPSAKLMTSDPSIKAKKRTPETVVTRSDPAGIRLANPPSSSDDDERITTVPDYLKPTPWSTRLIPISIVIVLVVVCIALVAPGINKGLQQANQEIQRRGHREKGTATTVNEAPPQASEASINAGGLASTESEKTAATDEAKAEVVSTTDAPVPGSELWEEELEELLQPMDTTDAKNASPDDKSILPQPGPSEAASAANLPPKPAPLSPEIIDSDIQVRYTSNEGIVIRNNEEKQQWFVVPRHSDFKPDELIANLEPFDATLEFGASNVRATLIGETIVKFLLPSDVAPQGLGVIGRGRILLQPTRQGIGGLGRFAIGIGEDTWRLEMLTEDTVCGLEVISREPSQFNKFNDYYWYQANLFVLAGSAKWTNFAGHVESIDQGMVLTIIPERAATSRSVPMNYPSTPTWSDASKRRNQPLRRFNSQFEKSFVSDEPVEQTMLSLLKSTPHPSIAGLATHCLSAADDYEGLVEALAECQHDEARAAARDGLRLWLPMNSNYGLLLIAELEKYYPPNEVDAVYRMLWGFTREEVKGSQVTSMQLANWLRSPKLEIRELADFWVERLKGKNDFKASANENIRETYVKKLEEQIIRDNGLVKGP